MCASMYLFTHTQTFFYALKTYTKYLNILNTVEYYKTNICLGIVLIMELELLKKQKSEGILEFKIFSLS